MRTLWHVTSHDSYGLAATSCRVHPSFDEVADRFHLEPVRDDVAVRISVNRQEIRPLVTSGARCCLRGHRAMVIEKTVGLGGVRAALTIMATVESGMCPSVRRLRWRSRHVLEIPHAESSRCSDRPGAQDDDLQMLAVHRTQRRRHLWTGARAGRAAATKSTSGGRFRVLAVSSPQVFDNRRVRLKMRNMAKAEVANRVSARRSARAKRTVARAALSGRVGRPEQRVAPRARW